MDPSLRVSEGINPFMNYYIHIYKYIFKVKIVMRTHSRYDTYLIMVQLVNGKFREIQDQILLVKIQTKKEWVLLTEFLFTSFYFD